MAGIGTLGLRPRTLLSILKPWGGHEKMVSKKVPVEEDESLEYGAFQPERLLAFLRSLREEADPEEDARALAELMQALDEDRPEGQKLFPEY